MDKLEIKCRYWYQGTAPKPIKLSIPGWAGDPNEHKNGDKPEPWHCIPFIEGSTYGLELCYAFDTECRVSIINDKVVFDGDFTEEQKKCNVPLPPFMSFSPGHFGTTSAVDIQVPADYILRLETHPRFYTDTTNTAPCAVPGHLQTEWWPKIFFIVFKNPLPGQTIVFKKNEPYAQILILPKKVEYDIKDMNNEESMERFLLDEKIDKHCKKFVKNNWTDHKGGNFDDKYKILSAIFAKDGLKGINDFLNQFENQLENPFKFRNQVTIDNENQAKFENENKAFKRNKKIPARLIKRRC